MTGGSAIDGVYSLVGKHVALEYEMIIMNRDNGCRIGQYVVLC